MDNEYRNFLRTAINQQPHRDQIVRSLSQDTIEYDPTGVWIDPAAPGFTHHATHLTDEELVRAYLLLKLAGPYGYNATPDVLQLERVYKPVGRPTGKGGRADILVRKPKHRGGECFLFVECKTPKTFDKDIQYIDGQLFRLSLQEQPRPRYLLYYTVELRSGQPHDRVILIDTTAFPSFGSWDSAGQPITNVIPARYGRPERRRFANVDIPTEQYQPLDKTSTPLVFSRLRDEIHDVIWGGGGTNNNEVFVYIVKLILCKIYDEKETIPNQPFQFQRLGDEVEPEPPSGLASRMNDIYKCAEESYLALPVPSEGPAFDATRLSPEKLAYVVGRLEGLSVTENVHEGDLLGEFFEHIVSQDFTQSRGQFFTPQKLVRFMLALSDVSELVNTTMRRSRDFHGRPRLPYVVDPSCGSGSFLIEYMKLVTASVGQPSVSSVLPTRVREAHNTWFAVQPNAWAREYIFGIENNHDLGLAAKVNMVLHGDGSMNTWIASGLLPFDAYWLDGRNNVLGTAYERDKALYGAATNEQFDFVFSNPPFSLKLSPDERRVVQGAFSSFATSLSERVFIERWYQLLREGGTFCCVLPETILETPNNSETRLFLIRFFRIRAVVSLPYDAFRPFTSTKTCVVLAEKRPLAEARQWMKEWNKIAGSEPTLSKREMFNKVLVELGWADDAVFMAEPESIGYKRRKGLADLHVRNDLYREAPDGTVETSDSKDAGNRTVLGTYRAKGQTEPSPQLGFWTKLERVGARDHLRLDPKYRWLWDYQEGVAYGNPDAAEPLSDILQVVKLQKVPKGELHTASQLLDLDSLNERQLYS